VRNVAEYLAHESRDLVSKAEGRQLLDGIDALRDDVDRFEARLQLLAQRLERPRS
jgi:ubiquinone biosynthesis protein UbiJ